VSRRDSNLQRQKVGNLSKIRNQPEPVNPHQSSSTSSRDIISSPPSQCLRNRLPKDFLKTLS
jgi:hypothetical protein